MDLEKISLIKELYSDCSSHIILLNNNYRVIWANHKEFVETIDLIRIKSIINEKTTNKDMTDIIIPLCINNVNYTLNITPMKQDSHIEGLVIRFTPADNLIEKIISKTITPSQLDFFSEIKLQLSGLISTITLLGSNLEKKEMYDEIQILNSQIHHCYKILSVLLNPSEITRYALENFNIMTLNASDFLYDICEYVNSILRHQNITINCNCDKNVLIDVDPDRFLVVLMNIFLNSIKNNISETVVINVKLKKTVDGAFLSITDNGIGITPQKLESIFKGYKIASLNENCNNVNQKGYGFKIINLFCQTFNLNYNILTKENEGTTLMFRIPISDTQKYPSYMNSKTADYLTNRFSNIYVAMSQIASINFL